MMLLRDENERTALSEDRRALACTSFLLCTNVGLTTLSVRSVYALNTQKAVPKE
jgi:hypothetical protein